MYLKIPNNIKVFQDGGSTYVILVEGVQAKVHVTSIFIRYN